MPSVFIVMHVKQSTPRPRTKNIEKKVEVKKIEQKKAKGKKIFMEKRSDSEMYNI